MLSRGSALALHVIVVTGSYILKGGPVDEAQMLLDDHLVKVQAMMASPFAKPFEAELVPWERKLTRLQDILDNCAIPVPVAARRPEFWLQMRGSACALRYMFGCVCRAQVPR